MAGSLPRDHGGGIHPIVGTKETDQIRPGHANQVYKPYSNHDPHRSVQQPNIPTTSMRPLQVNEALQFTPLTSILPHNAGMLDRQCSEAI